MTRPCATCIDDVPPTETRIAVVPYCDPKSTARNLVPQRRPGPVGDQNLISVWLSTFDPESSKRTLMLYRHVLQEFDTWRNVNCVTLDALTVHGLCRWRDQLRGASSTRATWLAIVKALLSFAHETGYLRFNVGTSVRAPRTVADPDARSLSVDHVRMLVEAAEAAHHKESARTRPRERHLGATRNALLLVKCLYLTGCRVSETVGIKWSDLRQRPDGDWQIAVLGKGHRQRKFPIPSRLAEAMLSHRRPAAGDSERVFSFGPRRAQTIIKGLARTAQISEAVSPHWLRHACATHALDAGAPVHVVQQTLGHASLATTSRYAHKRMDGASKYLKAMC